MPIDDKTRSETVLANVDNMLALAKKAVQQAEAEAPASAGLHSILDKLLLTVLSLRAQLHSIESERPRTRSRT
jgi:hypothetical protein